MNLLSITVRIYMLLMGIILLVSSAIYRWELDRMEKNEGILCPRSLYYSKIYRSNNKDNYYSQEIMEEDIDSVAEIPIILTPQNSPICRNMKWWKLFAEIGIIGGTFYLIFLTSLLIFSCCTNTNTTTTTRSKQDEDEEDEEDGGINDKKEVPQIKLTGTMGKGSKFCANWIIGMTGLLGLTVVGLALTFIFLGSRQLEAISSLDEKGNFGGTLEIYPPLILYICSVWHFVKLCGFSIWLGIIILCPSSLSIGQCVVI